MFRLPDPFAVITVDGEQTKTTSVIKKTLNPYWNESFSLGVNSNSTFTIQIFDQKKWKKEENQGFLGLVNILMSDVFDIDNEEGDEILTLDLKKGSNNTHVSGKIVLSITNRGVDNNGLDSRETSNAPTEFLSVERPTSRTSSRRSSFAGSGDLRNDTSPVRKTSPSRGTDAGPSGTGGRSRQESSSNGRDEDPLPAG